MDVEKVNEGLNEPHRPVWRVALQHFFFFSSWMIAGMSMRELYRAGKEVSWIIVAGIIGGAVYTAWMYAYGRLKVKLN